MQPYFLPHRHYFELIDSVDVFVLMDELPVSKRKWVKRNNFTLEGRLQGVSIPLVKHSDNDLISSLSIHPEFSRASLIRRFQMSRGKDPGWESLSPVLDRALRIGERQFSQGLIDSVVELSHRLGIHTRFIRQSEMRISQVRNASERILGICSDLGATSYVNNQSGLHIYNNELFKSSGILLKSFEQNFKVDESTSRSLFDVALGWEPDRASELFRLESNYSVVELS